MCDLRINKLHVSNFRKFEEETFQMNPQMNVFIGKNGSGKTALLEAVNVVLGAYLAAFKTYVPSRYVFNISKNDAHLKPLPAESKNVLTTGGIPQYPCRIECSLTWGTESKEVTFQRILLKSEGRTKFDGSNPMQPTVVKWENSIARADHSDKQFVLPLVLYISSARLWNENNKSSDNGGIDSRTDAYNRCLDRKHGIEFAFKYIQKLQAVAMEEQEGKKYPTYEAILSAVQTALRDELSLGESVIFSTRYSDDIVALKTAEGTVVPFSTLSDGYRNVIKMILDIAVRMCILNPYLEEKALTDTPGVVVIDEIDLSLHPTWQQRIIGILKELFPKIQFICATHSPFIVQSLEEGELQTLDRTLDDEYSGEGIEDIAEGIMGVEMPQYSEKKRKMYEAARAYYDALDACSDAEQLEKLRVELTELEAEYSDNPAYLALIHQRLSYRALEVENSETRQ